MIPTYSVNSSMRDWRCAAPVLLSAWLHSRSPLMTLIVDRKPAGVAPSVIAWCEVMWFVSPELAPSLIIQNHSAARHPIDGELLTCVGLLSRSRPRNVPAAQ